MQKVIYQGRKIKVAIDESVGKDGTLIKRDMILHPGAVVILPIVDEEHVCLLRNYRFVIGETLWEIPAGTLEPNEPIEVAAERELQEETGYRAKKWTYRGYFYASPGVLDEKLHLFFAEELTKGLAKPEADEQLEPVIVPIKTAMEMILNGSIKDAKTVSALLLWDHYRKA
ncbi:MAG: NUDIX hydrolase [Gemmataceae bacterium]|jgi:ADP-ribose pyrophosphatase|nr:NUDIX hydrolase [Gemmataceae bacterium]